MTRILRALLILLIPLALHAQVAPVFNPFPQGFSASFKTVISGDHTTAACTKGQILIDGTTFYGCTATGSPGTYVAFAAGSGCTAAGASGIMQLSDGAGGCLTSRVTITRPATAATIAFSADNETVTLPNGTLIANSRAVNTSGPLGGGGALSADLALTCATCGVTGSPLSQFAATTSAQLAGVLTDETGTGLAVFSVSPALTGTPTAPTPSAGDSSTTLPTTAFVATAIANAVAAANPATSVLAASTSSQTGTYSNGASGIGATFTITATGAYILDGTSISTIGQRVLLKNQSSAFQNGVYTATVVGTIAVSPVFTRALDYDQSSDINNTGAIFVQTGTANILTSWLLTSTVTTVGTDALNYSQSSSNPSNLVTAVSPGVGLAHFAGGTQQATSSLGVSADLNITTTTCTAPQVLTAISATAVGTCSAPLLTQNSQSANYTTVLGDAGKAFYHPSADTTARTITIDSNANVAYLIGTCMSFFNDTSAGVWTIAITSDTLVLAGAGTTGSRTLAASNVATACKMTSTRWMISGSSGLT